MLFVWERIILNKIGVSNYVENVVRNAVKRPSLAGNASDPGIRPPLPMALPYESVSPWLDQSRSIPVNAQLPSLSPLRMDRIASGFQEIALIKLDDISLDKAIFMDRAVQNSPPVMSVTGIARSRKFFRQRNSFEDDGTHVLVVPGHVSTATRGRRPLFSRESLQVS
ncbi:unnamed protein product [Nezara viridula]|uniref:Uncharacterized protein n=1 Tax=Nezara viridula TaxID=85310 RepID=A0A9P0HCZ9_NEZVI|nr:unnamed protein product [Nezara viridula]